MKAEVQNVGNLFGNVAMNQEQDLTFFFSPVHLLLSSLCVTDAVSFLQIAQMTRRLVKRSNSQVNWNKTVFAQRNRQRRDLVD